MTPAQIKQARQALGLNQTDLATKLGWSSKRQVVNLERGHSDCQPSTALAIECLLRRAGEWSDPDR